MLDVMRIYAPIRMGDRLLVLDSHARRVSRGVRLLSSLCRPPVRYNCNTNLRILQFMACYWGGVIKFRLGAKSFPRLDELVVHNMGFLPPVAVGSPVLLRTVSFYDINHAEWFKILSECRETLVEVFLYRCRLPPQAQIHLPKLKFLALSNMLNFQNDIVAPGLNIFQLRTNDSPA